MYTPVLAFTIEIVQHRRVVCEMNLESLNKRLFTYSTKEMKKKEHANQTTFGQRHDNTEKFNFTASAAKVITIFSFAEKERN